MNKATRQKYSRTTINPGQIKVLELVYKYRFVSRQLLAQSLGIKPQNGLYEKLETLVQRGYLAKRFDKRLKLQAIPAAYYLTPQGFKILQTIPDHDHITDTTIKASYRDKSVSQSFINHTLAVYKYTNVLARYYPTFKVFTRRELGQYNYFPSQLPDAFLSLPAKHTEKSPQRFFLDILPDGVPRPAIDARIANYCEFFDEGGWNETGSDYPVLLFIIEQSSAERRLQRYIQTQLTKFDMDELAVYTTTAIALDNMQLEALIWTSAEDPDELAELSSIL